MSQISVSEDVVFPQTHWSLVAEAGCAPDECKRRALTKLIVTYLPALRQHLILRKRLSVDEAEDLLQAFLTEKILEKRLIDGADPARGKFRNFLLVALDRFLSNHRRRQFAQCRSPRVMRSLSEDLDFVEPAVQESDVFDVAWAKEVLVQAIELMQAQCVAAGRVDLWEIFEGRILRPTLHQAQPIAYSELVSRFNFMSPAHASNALVTANRQFARIIRQVVSRYERDEASIEDEMADLRRILAGSAGSPK